MLRCRGWTPIHAVSGADGESAGHASDESHVGPRQGLTLWQGLQARGGMLLCAPSPHPRPWFQPAVNLLLQVAGHSVDPAGPLARRRQLGKAVRPAASTSSASPQELVEPLLAQVASTALQHGGVAAGTGGQRPQLQRPKVPEALPEIGRAHV